MISHEVLEEFILGTSYKLTQLASFITPLLHGLSIISRYIVKVTFLGIFVAGILMSMLMTIFSSSSFCDKKVACSNMLKYGEYPKYRYTQYYELCRTS